MVCIEEQNHGQTTPLSLGDGQGERCEMVETHPFEPWLPANARLLMLGTFPPSERRWCMPWYYPNLQNDMWRIFGLAFFGNKEHFLTEDKRSWRLDELKTFLAEKGVAIYDTAYRIRRTKGTASDKDLEVVEPVDLDALLTRLPDLQGVLTAGQLATRLFTTHYNIKEKIAMGEYATFQVGDKSLRLYRMPSSSRAYPMAVEKKTEYYQRMFNSLIPASH